MWIFTKRFFCSVVSQNNNMLVVRFRTYEHAKQFKKISGCEKIFKTYGRDYRYRVVIDKTKFAKIISNVIADIDYFNFKDAVLTRGAGKNEMEAMYDVWLAMANLQSKSELEMLAPLSGGRRNAIKEREEQEDD